MGVIPFLIFSRCMSNRFTGTMLICSNKKAARQLRKSFMAKHSQIESGKRQRSQTKHTKMRKRCEKDKKGNALKENLNKRRFRHSNCIALAWIRAALTGQLPL